MIGRLGDSAMAAVGQGGFMFNLAVALILGLATSVQAMTARFAGEGKTDEVSAPVSAGMITGVIFGVPLTLVGFFVEPHVFPFLHSDKEVIKQGTIYVQYLLAGSVLLGATVSFQGFWNGLGKPIYYMAPLLIIQVLNIIFNYLLIFGKFGFPELGVAGAALGTVLATFLGVLIHLAIGFTKAREYNFLKKLPSAAHVKSLLSLAVPTSIQQMSFNLGYLIFMGMIGQMGTQETAAATALLTITLVGLMFPMGLGTASATLVGQSLGRGEPEEAHRWAWDVTKVGVIGMLTLCLPMVLIPDMVLGLFLTNPESIAVGRVPMQLVAVIMGMFSINFTMMYSLYGAGGAKRVMYTSMSMQWLVFLPGVYVVGPVLGYGLLEVWIVQMIYGLLLGVAYTWQWQSGFWKKLVI